MLLTIHAKQPSTGSSEPNPLQTVPHHHSSIFPPKVTPPQPPSSSLQVWTKSTKPGFRNLCLWKEFIDFVLRLFSSFLKSSLWPIRHQITLSVSRPCYIASWWRITIAIFYSFVQFSNEIYPWALPDLVGNNWVCNCGWVGVVRCYLVITQRHTYCYSPGVVDIVRRFCEAKRASFNVH